MQCVKCWPVWAQTGGSCKGRHYYDLTAGVVELIAGATGIIADGISNGEIELTVKSCEGQETTPSDGEGVNT